MLVCVDFLNSFDLKIFPSPKKHHYLSRSKQNLRRLKLMNWVVRLFQLFKSSNPSASVLEDCYTHLAKLLMHQNEKVFRNSLIAQEGPQQRENEVKEIIKWIQACEEDGDFAAKVAQRQSQTMEHKHVPRQQSTLPMLHEQDSNESMPEAESDPGQTIPVVQSEESSDERLPTEQEPEILAK